MTTASKAPPEMEIALLGYLRQRPMHAYEIYAQLRHSGSSGLDWRFKQGHLYALLARLEDAGYLVATMQQQGARPPRRLLALTEAGQDAFEEWLEEPVAHGRDFRLTFLAKLFFALREGNRRVLALIARQSAACEYWLADLRERIAALSGDAEELCYDWLVIAFRAGQIEAILAWLDACDASLGSASA